MATFWIRGLLAWAILPLMPAASALAARTEFMEYDLTWVGVSVGTMTVQSREHDDGTLVRSIHIWNRPWIALVYPVDNTIECRIESTPEGRRHTLTKKMGEKDFTQDDVLTFWPDAGRALWSNALQKTSREFPVPPSARDFVSFFFDLRDSANGGPWNARGDYQLVMDDGVHALEIRSGEARLRRVPGGRLPLIPVEAISKSPVLFSRNRPRTIWVSAAQPVVIYADVDTRFGTVRGTLAKWTLDGLPLDPASPRPPPLDSASATE